MKPDQGETSVRSPKLRVGADFDIHVEGYMGCETWRTVLYLLGEAGEGICGDPILETSSSLKDLGCFQGMAPEVEAEPDQRRVLEVGEVAAVVLTS